MERDRFTKRIYLVFFAFSLIAFSCASQRERRLESIQTKYPQWDQATVEKLAALQIESGMTKEMVTAALGRPAQETVKEGETVWEYIGYRLSSDGEGIVIAHRYVVYLSDGKVIRTTGDPNKIGYK